MRDAAMVAISAFKRAHPEELPRVRAWKTLAEKLNVPIVENEELAKDRLERALAAVHADLMGDDD
jgi:hypothetical protein